MQMVNAWDTKGETLRVGLSPKVKNSIFLFIFSVPIVRRDVRASCETRDGWLVFLFFLFFFLLFFCS